MADWKLWRAMARESLRAAYKIESDAPRSSISRYYYAAYQATSAVLIYRGLVPPPDREAWSHETTPQMLNDHYKPLLDNPRKRSSLVSYLTYLYKLRVYADYISGETTIGEKIETARKHSKELVRVAESLLQQEEQTS